MLGSSIHVNPNYYSKIDYCQNKVFGWDYPVSFFNKLDSFFTQSSKFSLERKIVVTALLFFKFFSSIHDFFKLYKKSLNKIQQNLNNIKGKLNIENIDNKGKFKCCGNIFRTLERVRTTKFIDTNLGSIFKAGLINFKKLKELFFHKNESANKYDIEDNHTDGYNYLHICSIPFTTNNLISFSFLINHSVYPCLMPKILSLKIRYVSIKSTGNIQLLIAIINNIFAEILKICFKTLIILILLNISSINDVNAKCTGRFVNPITDICWECLFPVSIGSISLFSSKNPDTENPPSPICMCGSPIPRIGIAAGFWEPVRLVDVTKRPFCFANLGGVEFDPGIKIGTGSSARKFMRSFA